MTKIRKIKIVIWLILVFSVLVWWKKDVWNDFFENPLVRGEKINFVGLTEEKIYLISFIPEEKSWVFLSLPNSVYLDTVYNYGKYKVGTLLKLGEIEKRGEKILQESIKENWAFPTDGYLVFSESNLNSKKEVFKNFLTALRNKNKNNFSLVERIFLVWQINKVKDKDFIFLDGEKTGFLKEFSLPDGSKGFEIDKEKFLKFVSQYFKDFKLIEENLAIAVWNGTSHQGLAEGRAKIIEMLGGRIVEVANSSAQIKESCLLLTSEGNKKKYTTQKLLKIFNCQWQKKEDNDIRKDIILIVGENYWKKLTQR